MRIRTLGLVRDSASVVSGSATRRVRQPVDNSAVRPVDSTWTTGDDLWTTGSGVRSDRGSVADVNRLTDPPRPAPAVA